MNAAFVVIAAALVLGTLAWVLQPLWQTRRLPTAVAIALLAVLTGLLYQLVGTPAAFDPTLREAPRTVEEAIQQLEQDLERDPNQIDGLRLLGNAYMQTGQPVKANAAFGRAAKLAPDDPDLLAEAAQARAANAPERRFDDTAIAWLRETVRLQPMHQRGRWFLGIALRQRGKHAEAANTWEPLLGIVDSNTANALRPQIDAARADAGLPPLGEKAVVPGSAKALSVRVRIDPALLQEMRNPTIFIIARKTDGSPMPVAVERHPVDALPETVVLDDSDGPMPTQRLSSLGQVDVVVRVSRSGDATKQAGDIESPPLRVSLPAGEPVQIDLKPE